MLLNKYTKANGQIVHNVDIETLLEAGESQSDIDSALLPIKKSNSMRLLVSVCDSKQNAAAELFRGVSPYTREMKDRDSRNYTRAKAGAFEQGVNEAVITAHEAFWEGVDGYLDMIELARKSVTAIIDGGDVDKADEIIASFSKLGKDTTPEMLTELLAG